MKVSRAGFLKGLMASFLTPIVAKATYVNPYTQPTPLKDLPPVEKAPVVKLDDYYEKYVGEMPLSGIWYPMSGVCEGLYGSAFMKEQTAILRDGKYFYE